MYCNAAIAELLDNAVDEVCLRNNSFYFFFSELVYCLTLLFPQIQNGATFVKIDKIDIAKNNSPALVFQGKLVLNDCQMRCVSNMLFLFFQLKMMALGWIPMESENA